MLLGERIIVLDRPARRTQDHALEFPVAHQLHAQVLAPFTGFGPCQADPQVWVTDEVHHLKDIGDWPGLASLVAVECTRQVIGGASSTERRYFISSLKG